MHRRCEAWGDAAHAPLSMRVRHAPPRGAVLAERLRGLGKQVSVRVVPGEEHGWDKRPPIAQKANVGLEYVADAEAVRNWLEPEDQGTTSESGRKTEEGDEIMVGSKVLAAQGMEKVSARAWWRNEEEEWRSSGTEAS